MALHGPASTHGAATAAPRASDGSDEAWCLKGTGNAATLAREIDWSRTALGPVSAWSASLKAAVAMVLNARQPMSIRWGPELVQICNDAFLSSFARGKHPAPMGQSGAGCWQEIWSAIRPQIDATMQHGKASWYEDQPMPMMRDGHLEDAYWSYGYSPLFDDDGRIGGALLTGRETTARVLARRRQQVLQTLARRTVAAQLDAAVLGQLFEIASGASADIPFLLLYRAEGTAFVLRYFSGVDEAALKTLSPVWQPSAAGDDDGAVPLHASPQRLELAQLGAPDGIRGARDAMLVRCTEHDRLVFGLNPRLPLNHGHVAFLLQIATIVGAACDRVAAARMQSVVALERDSLLLQSPVATAVLTGPEHVFQIVNPKFSEMIGRDVVGRIWREALPELAASELGALFDRVYASGRHHIAEELWLPALPPAAGSVCVKCSIEPLRSVEGRIYGLMAVLAVITERVLARQALKRASEEREQMVRELQAAARTKDEFLAMLGHELRNPLAPIVATLDVMRLRAGGVESREVAIIRRQSEHMVRLVDDLLDVGRIVSGKVDLKDERVAIPEVLREAARMAGPLLEQRGHRFERHVERDGLVCRGDAVRLAQCVSNLLTNAARYTPPGGRIELRAWRDQDEVLIRVSDNGRGIAADRLPEVFELFNQGGREHGGLGIGLALVQNLMRLHGGGVTAKSAGPGQGCEFTLRLPVAGSDAPEPVRQEPFEPSQPGALSSGRQVLVVDDNQDAGESLAELLRLDGHEVRVALEPASALTLLGEFDAEIVILDIGLPGMDGYELAARMREQHPEASRRFLALTGYGAALDIEKSRAAGFDAHLVKPVDMARLAGLVAGRDEL